MSLVRYLLYFCVYRDFSCIFTNGRSRMCVDFTVKLSRASGHVPRILRIRKDSGFSVSNQWNVRWFGRQWFHDVPTIQLIPFDPRITVRWDRDPCPFERYKWRVPFCGLCAMQLKARKSDDLVQGQRIPMRECGVSFCGYRCTFRKPETFPDPVSRLTNNTFPSRIQK